MIEETKRYIKILFGDHEHLIPKEFSRNNFCEYCNKNDSPHKGQKFYVVGQRNGDHVKIAKKMEFWG
ncbi:MAG: hypothetical protein OEX08_00490 [Candidatus Nomurabacteria bacterium]|nr:hypothetical protein [Candidatus Nomurabacteria bacterium]